MYISTVDMGKQRTQTNIKFLFEKFGVPNTMINLKYMPSIHIPH